MKRKTLLLLLLLALGLPWAALAQKTLPYEYGFENNDLAAEGWTMLSSSFMTGISADGHSGEYGFMFYKSPDPQYLISPELSTTINGLAVEFYYQSSASGYPKPFRVGYSTTGNGVSDFTFGDEITTTNGQWTFFSQTFDANTKYIAIKYEYNASYTSLYLDDFYFEEYAAYPKPKNLVVTTYTSSTATLDWSARTGQDHWDLYYTTNSTVPDANTTPSITNTATKPYTITGLESGVTYHAYVRGNYNNGEHYSDWSNACDFEVGCYTPTVVEAQASCNQAYFAWIPVGVETSWQVAFSDQQGFDPDNVTPETVTTQYFIKENLATGVTYYARVRAVCGAGDYSDWSAEVSMTTACFAPSNLHASSVSPTTATLKWQPGSTESQWQISYSTTANFAPENGTIITVNANPYNLEGLTLNTPYYAYVRAVCTETLFSDWSSISTFTPKYELTVSDDETNYNMYVPFFGSFVSYVTKSQFIIPASALTDLLYANINKLTFYAGVETANFGSATFDVLISELDGVTVFENSAFFDWSEMTSVYSGSLTVGNNKMEITLNNPYQYMGGDLLIGFDQSIPGNDVTVYWYGAATTGYSAYGGMEAPANSYSSYSRYQFIPKTTFSYTPGTAPTCLKPKNFSASNVGATSATLSWTNGDAETAWVLQYATDANFTQNVVSVNVTTNPYTLTGLTPETTYYARVKADCGGDDYSTWSNACSFMPSAIQTVVINDGTTTNTNIPFRSSIASTTNVKSQFIITSDVLENVAGNHITGLTFHTSEYYPTASYPGAVFKVYLSLTEMTEFQNTTPVDWNTLTEVYSGSLSISDNKMVVTLSAPYLYTGGNLLVAFDETTLCSSSDYIYWNGVSTNDYPALSYSGSYYRRQFLPKMTLTYNTVIAICSTPTNLSIETTSNTATLTWIAGDEETNWNVQYKDASASDWSEVIAVEDTPTCTINGLSALTDYQVRVQADCGGSVSSWVTESFTTSCGSVGIPYSYDFSDVTIGANGAFPQCWTRINDSENSNYNYYPFVTATNKVLKFIASANTNAPAHQIAVMPEMTANINTLRMSFKAYLSSGNTNKTLSVGVMTDPNDASTFTKVVDVVVRGTNASTFYPISLEGYHGDGHYLAFKCDKLTSGSEYFIFIDDITMETVPTVALVNPPYSYNFDAATTGYNAFPPDGWHFSNTYYPYVYESASLANSGSNFLLMQKPSYESACYAALPAINTTDNPINTLKLSFQARMWNSTIYSTYLSIGVMTDPSDISTFQLISSVSVRNDYSLHEIYFDDYAGEGQYIALRCYNTDNYICIDDIEVSVAPTCRQPLDLSTQYTHAHEAEIRWKTRDLRQCNYQVSYSTDETFNPEDGTIVDVEFENTLVNAGTDYRDYYLTCLNANTTYYYYVRANCGNGDFSEWSDDYASLTTDEACPEPYDFGTTLVKNTYAIIHWYGDLDANWEFRYKKTADDEWITPATFDLASGEGNELLYRLENLETNVEYVVQLRLHCGMYTCPAVDDGYSEWVTTSFTTSEGCQTPSGWMCMTHMGTSATLEWNQTGEENYWQIRYRLSTENEYPVGNIVLTDYMPEAKKQRWTITGLQANSMYYWQVRAYCDENDQSAWSAEKYFFTGGEKVTVDKAHPFYEDFESVLGMPDGWMRCNQYNYNLDYYYPWSFTLAEGPSWDERPGNHGIYNNSGDYHGSTSVLTPEMHIDENAYSAKLSFWDYCDYAPSAISGQNISYGSMQVMVSSDHGENFDYVWWSFGPKRYWHQFFVDLDEYIGKDIIIRFDYWWANNNPNFDWYIDDVKVQVFDNSFGSGSDVTTGNWDDPDMWGNGTPSGDDDVIINANVTIPDGVVAQANNIVINTDTINTGNRAQKFGKLIIANGGQLITNNAVEVTAQKTVTPWTTNPAGGWYFIASPVDGTLKAKDVDNMLTDETAEPYSYDLYRLNGTQWENYHAHNTNEQPFYLQNGNGYLYANANNTTLEFTGDIRLYNQTSNTVPVSEGWNLIGNPYTFAAYPNASYYVLNDERTALNPQTKSAGLAVPPCEGIIVKALSDGTVAFSKEAPAGQTGGGNLQIALAQTNTRGADRIDNAIVSFNEGDELPKFYFGESLANITIPQNGEDYSIVSAEAQGELPLNFKTNENGSYTLRFSSLNTEFSYLHLIDNLTGNDVDLLETPSYTFDARHTDYASRFKLVFVKSDADMGDNFAFISDGELIVNGEGTLQVFDVLGHQLFAKKLSTLNSHLSIFKSPGVYVLRLIDGDNVKNQKIIIK